LKSRDVGGNARGGLRLGRVRERKWRTSERDNGERNGHHGFRRERPDEFHRKVRGEFCIGVRELALAHSASPANILRQYFATQKFSRAIICQFIGTGRAELTTDSRRRRQRSVHGFGAPPCVEPGPGND
jgi:hypothetical protein